nr:reverse transcriptase domain-containing protein [Tanacetum cinerariifolium]
MSVMANTTPLVTTVTKPATNSRDADVTPRVNIQDYCEEYYEDILPIIMDKFRCDKRKEVHARLDTSNEDCPKDRKRFCGVGESYDDSCSHSYRGENLSRHMKRRRDTESPLSSVLKSDFSDERYRKSRSKRHKSTDEDDLTWPWMCEEEDPFIPRIRNFESSRRTRMPNNMKIYDGTGDPDDHVKIFQAAAQVERWAMPTWCHMFNSTLIGAARVWFDELPPESVDSYKDPKAAFIAYFMQQKKYFKDPVEIHNIKQKDGETIKDFMERFKVETGRMKGAPECMQIFGFMHGVNNPELTKRLNEHVLKTMEEMMITTTAFIRGEAAAASKKKGHTSWKAHDQSKRQTLEKRSDFRGHPREGRGSNRFTPLQGRQKRFLRPRGQKVTQSFERVKEITFPPLTASSGVKGPLVIEAADGRTHDSHHVCGRRLLVTIGDADRSTRAWINFMIVRSLSLYNGIIGRPEIREIQAVPSTAHGMLKFSVKGGIVTIRSTILIPAECTSVFTSSAVSKEERTRPENFKATLHPDFLDQEVAIEGTLSAKGRTKLCSILKKNLDIFARKPPDMTGVPRSVAEHRLNIREGYSPVRQKKRGQALNVLRPYKQRIVTPYQRLTGKLNLSLATLSSVSWTLTKATTRYSWQNRKKRKQLSTLDKGCIATQKCLSASRTLAPHTSGSGWWTKLSIAKLVGT